MYLVGEHINQVEVNIRVMKEDKSDFIFLILVIIVAVFAVICKIMGV